MSLKQAIAKLRKARAKRHKTLKHKWYDKGYAEGKKRAYDELRDDSILKKYGLIVEKHSTYMMSSPVKFLVTAREEPIYLTGGDGYILIKHPAELYEHEK